MKITTKSIEAAIARRKAAVEAAKDDTDLAMKVKAYRDTLRDDDMPGLSLVINRKSASWVFSYRPAGVEQVETSPGTFKTQRPGTRHLKLGDTSTLSPEEARRKAAEAKLAVVAKMDPAVERRAMVKERESAAKRASCEALLPLYEDYLRNTTSRKTSRKLGERYINDQVANLKAAFAKTGIDVGQLQPSEITQDHVAALPVKAKGTTTARHWHQSLHLFLLWAHSQKRVSAIVTRDVPKPPKGRAKTRWLTGDEIGKVWRGAAQINPTYGSYLRWLMCLPSRRGEGAEVRWSDVDLHEKVWKQSGEDTKNGDDHRLYLHPLAMEVLTERLDAARQEDESRDDAYARLVAADALVFQSPRARKVMTAFSGAVKQVHKVSGTSNWSIHDLRRTCVSHLGEKNFDVGVADQLLNHRASATRGGIIGVYQRSQRWPAQVAMMEAWGDILSGFINGKPKKKAPSNVVKFRKGA